MASRVISGEAAATAGPMPWRTIGGTVGPSRHALQYSTPDSGSQPESEMDQRRAKMAIAEAAKDRLVIEARGASRREGEAAGRLAAEAEVRPVLQRLAASLQQVSELPARLRAQSEADLVQLAVAIAQRILHRELNIDPAVIGGLVRVGLEKIRMQDMMRVRVCPDHLAAIRECLVSAGAAHVEVAADPALERGGVLFETSRGKLDVSIGTQLQEIERGLTDRLRGPR
ncbi:MAG: FliH/SctL family protein [Candidatus Solibacter sp.]